jgi:hypothetical protein
VSPKQEAGANFYVSFGNAIDDEDLYNLVTIDVQGYELEVFQGSRETLKN